MAIEQFRTPTIDPEDNAQRNASFQTSNPNVTVAPPTPMTDPTEMTQPQTTDNPANNGIVPSSNNRAIQQSTFGPAPTQGFSVAPPEGTLNYSQADMNKQLISASTQPNPGAYNNELEKAYGIGNYGMTPEDISQLPQAAYDAQGNYVVRNVQSFKLTPETSEKYRKFKDDFTKIKIQGKQAFSGAGINQDFGVSIQEAKNLLGLMLDTDGAKKAFQSNDASAKQLLASAQLLSQFQPGTPEYENAATKFKLDLATWGQKISNDEFAKYGGRTALTDQIGDYIRNTRSLGELYKMDEKGITNFIQNAESSFNKTTVQYEKLKDLPSYKTKQDLMKNPVYQNFLDYAQEHNPAYSKQIEGFRKSTIISDAEKKFIKDVFVGQYAKNFFEAKEAYAEQFGVFAAAKAFAGFDDLMDVKDAQYKSAEDDMLATGDWGNFQFSLNSGQGTTPTGYSGSSTGQSGGQSYNTPQARTHFVEQTIG